MCKDTANLIDLNQKRELFIKKERKRLRKSPTHFYLNKPVYKGLRACLGAKAGVFTLTKVKFSFMITDIKNFRQAAPPSLPKAIDTAKKMK